MKPTAGYETLLIKRVGKVAVITFNRAEKKNAMNPQLHRDMTRALDELRYDDDVAVLVITGSGNSFSAGMDLKEFFHQLKTKDPAEYDRVTRMAVEWRGRTLRYYPKPTIAMVNGFCFGGAFAIVEGCDLAVAANEATFGLSEINFRMFPGGAVSKSLANMFHSRDALLYAMTGRTFNGRQAAALKFVNFSVPAAELEVETMKLAQEIAAKDPAALKGCKDGYRFSLEMSWEASMNFTNAKENEVLMQQQGVSWLKEGVGDFVEGKYRPGLGGHENLEKKP
ncbi:MAG: p-hydroxycinnamoyl CoA hydratase/lyase [Betaproteobacteria bacterium]|nr:p-hydroxycinnamoyl CoA hydratase/lyase [Betaproteobacteria bacterium]